MLLVVAKKFQNLFEGNIRGKSLRESWLPATDGHLCVPGARHGSLVDVGAPHDDVSVVYDDHLAVHVDHLPHSAARSDNQFLIRIGSHHCSDALYGSRSLAGILPYCETRL